MSDSSRAVSVWGRRGEASNEAPPAVSSLKRATRSSRFGVLVLSARLARCGAPMRHALKLVREKCKVDEETMSVSIITKPVPDVLDMACKWADVMPQQPFWAAGVTGRNPCETSKNAVASMKEMVGEFVEKGDVPRGTSGEVHGGALVW